MTAAIPLGYDDYMVFASIMKWGRNARYTLRFQDFARAMIAIGFAYNTGDGSRRRFVPTGKLARIIGNTPFCYHMNGNKVEWYTQDSWKKAFEELYGWNAEMFVLTG